MGGGGDFYDRDVTSRAYRSSVTGVSSVAERELDQRTVDPEFLPKGRRLVCKAKNPLVYLFDVTGSMDNLPKIIYDKWPGIVGQIVARKYLPDPKMSLAAVGDITSDRAPLQMADFSVLRNLDRYFKRIWFEGNGGGQNMESYEVAAYYYAYLCDLPKAENPICLITGDEGFREELYGDDLAEHFGGEHQDTTATQVFADLIKKFKGNVFHIHRRYSRGEDAAIVRQWEGVLGKERIIHLPEDLAIGDVTLGVYAIVSGARTLAQYVEDMRTRRDDLGKDVVYEPQSAERVRAVERALQPLKDFKPVRFAPKRDRRRSDEGTAAKSGASGAPKPPKKSWKV